MTQDKLPAIRFERRWWHELPPFLFYIPIAFAIIILMIRYRSLSAPLSANYGLINGGLYPRSKKEFFDKLGDEHPLLPKSITLSSATLPDDAKKQYQAFTDHDLDEDRCKIVLKPDDGIRGTAVTIISSLQEFEENWASAQNAGGQWLVQEYVGGLEVGLFYIKEHPDKPGKITSITLKHGLILEGDGKSRLKELLEEADIDGPTRSRIAQANQAILSNIPGRGEKIELIPVRNHHLGATFQDVSYLITSKLNDALVRHLDAIEGYHFGRLDARVPSISDLVDGQDIKILEVNALYSEPVHAYDPQYGLRHALAIFISYWRMAFLAGKANIAAGKPKIAFRYALFPKK